MEKSECKRQAIGDFATTVSGGTPATHNQAYWQNGNIAWINSGELSQHDFIREPSTFITEKAVKNSAAKLVPKGSVGIALTGATTGDVGFFEIETSTNQSITAILPNNTVDNLYLFYYLKNSRKQILNFNIGSAQPHINKQIVDEFMVEFPCNFKEQSKIAEVLLKADQAIEQTESLIAKQQRIKTGLMQDLFTHGIDEHGNLRSEETHEYKDSPLGRIPVEWEVLDLGTITIKIADRDHTTPKYVDDGVLMISPMAFYDDESIDFGRCPRITEKAHLKNRKKTDCSPGDIILHRIGAGLGRVRVVLENHPEIYSLLHSLALVRPNFKLTTTAFIKWSFRTLYLQNQMNLGTQSIGVPDLGLDKISTLQFKLPRSIKEQANIGSILDTLQKHINDLLLSRSKLCSLKTALMQDLLTGKVRVTSLLEKKEVCA